MMRAAHQILDTPKVFDDPMALRIVGSQGASEIRSGKRWLKTRLPSYLRAIVVARSRFVEDELSAAVERGVRQYVVLGAGLDTFAYRSPYSSSGLRVFEVDHPATQAWKQQLLAAENICVPESMSFAPMDFESQSLADALRKADFRTDRPCFISWLGVSMYLSRETLLTTMKSIASSAASGSAIVFDYVIPPSTQNILRRSVFRALTLRLARIGEPWISFFDPNSLAMDLKAIGYSNTEDIGPEEINSRFFKNRPDKLMVGSFGHLMRAQL
jgi:methyltransferase (TIGR00027 family)